MHVILLSMSFSGNMYRSVLTRMLQTAVLIHIPDFWFFPKSERFFLLIFKCVCLLSGVLLSVNVSFQIAVIKSFIKNNKKECVFIS